MAPKKVSLFKKHGFDMIFLSTDLHYGSCIKKEGFRGSYV